MTFHWQCRLQQLMDWFKDINISTFCMLMYINWLWQQLNNVTGIGSVKKYTFQCKSLANFRRFVHKASSHFININILCAFCSVIDEFNSFDDINFFQCSPEVTRNKPVQCLHWARLHYFVILIKCVQHKGKNCNQHVRGWHENELESLDLQAQQCVQGLYTKLFAEQRNSQLNV